MDPFITPPRRSAAFNQHDVISKHDVLEIIQSVDFESIAIHKGYFASDMESAVETFIDDFCSALKTIMIRSSPPNTTPRKILQRAFNFDLSEDDEDLNSPTNPVQQRVKSTFPRPIKQATMQSPTLQIGHSSQFTVIPTPNVPSIFSAPNEVNIPDILDERKVISQFAAVQPWLKTESMEKDLPREPMEGYRVLKMMEEMTPYLVTCKSLGHNSPLIGTAARSQHAAGTPEPRVKDATKVPGFEVRRSSPHENKDSHVLDIDPSYVEFYSKILQEKLQNEPGPFTCVDATMKETPKLPFVPIIGSVRSVTNDAGPFQGRHDFAT